MFQRGRHRGEGPRKDSWSTHHPNAVTAGVFHPAAPAAQHPPPPWRPGRVKRERRRDRMGDRRPRRGNRFVLAGVGLSESVLPPVLAEDGRGGNGVLDRVQRRAEVIAVVRRVRVRLVRSAGVRQHDALAAGKHRQPRRPELGDASEHRPAGRPQPADVVRGLPGLPHREAARSKTRNQGGFSGQAQGSNDPGKSPGPAT